MLKCLAFVFATDIREQIRVSIFGHISKSVEDKSMV